MFSVANPTTANPSSANGPIAYIQAVLNHLNNPSLITNGDTFDNALAQDEGSSALEFLPTNNAGQPVFNFAVGGCGSPRASQPRSARGGVTAYWTTDGDGAYDKLVKSGSNWIWTDGAGQVTETYVTATESGAWRISTREGPRLQHDHLQLPDRDRSYRHNHGRQQRRDHRSRVRQIYLVGQQRHPHRHRLQGPDERSTARPEPDLLRLRRAEPPELGHHRSLAGVAASDGYAYTISYAYGTNGLISQVTQSDGSRTDIAYDTAGRVSSLTEYATATETRVTALSYGDDYTTVTTPDGQVTRLEYSGTNLAPTSLYQWGALGTLLAAAGTINGQEAVKVTSSVGATYTGLGTQFSASAGEQVTFAISLQAVAGSDTTQALGLFSSNDGGFTGGIRPRILSGPGQISQRSDGLWQLTGLSTTQATRIEITRAIGLNGYVGAYAYVDYPGDTPRRPATDLRGRGTQQEQQPRAPVDLRLVERRCLANGCRVYRR